MIVDTEEAASALAERIKGTNLLVLDVETHETEQYHNKELMGVAIGLPSGLALDTYYVLPGVFPALHEALGTCEIIGHNLVFDLEILRQNGLDFQGKIWDTMLMAHIVWENYKSYKLDMLSLKLFGLRKMDMSDWKKAFGGWNNIPPWAMGPYAEQDLELTWKLFCHFIGKLREEQVTEIWPDLMQYVRDLQVVMQSGIRVDRQLVTDLSGVTAEQIEQIAKRLRAIGITNPGSSVQVRNYLYKTLKLNPPWYTKAQNPQPSTDNAAVSLLAHRHPEHREILELILEHRTLSKALSTWYLGFLKRMGERDYLHPGLQQHGTKTGRLSCAEPNLQQIPRNSDRVKRIFLDDGDWALCEFDYSQIELRVGSWYTKNYMKDSTMFNLYQEGEDVHTRTANMIGTIQELGPKEGRQVGKTGNFLWIYNGGPARLKDMLWRDARMEVDEARARSWTIAFHEAYPGFKEMNKFAANLHRKRGYVKLYNGRRRRIIERNDRNEIKHYAAFNSIVQGAGGVVLMYAMRELIDLQERGAPFRVCNSVHDSVWVYILKSRLEEMVPEIQEIMAAPAEKQFELAFPVDFKRIGGNASDS